MCLFLQPGKPIYNNGENAPKLFIEHDPEDPEVISGKVMCDGKIVSYGQSVTECLDFFFKFIWIFRLNYPKGASVFFKFLQFKLYKIRFGVSDRVPSSVNEVARIFNIN